MSKSQKLKLFVPNIDERKEIESSRDQLLRAITNDKIPQKVKIMWSPIVWGAVNMDILLKIMGKVPCDAHERNKIKQFLLDEEKYELFVAMIYCDNDEK